MVVKTVSDVTGTGSGGVSGPVGGGGIALTDVAAAEVVEYRTLILAQITAEGVTLTGTPGVDAKVKVDIVGGPTGEIGVDYSVTGTALSWNTLAFAPLLAIGDKLRITYLTT